MIKLTEEEKPKGYKTYTDGWELTKDTLRYTRDTEKGRELAKAYGYNVTSMKKGTEELIKRKGGKLTINWL